MNVETADAGIDVHPAAPRQESATSITLHVVHAPLRGLDPAGDHAWLAIDDDPQFLVTLPRAQPAGFYLFTAQLHGAHVTSPCVYFDLGNGWCEASRYSLVPDAGSDQWSALLDLPEWSSSVRLDPTDSEGYLHFAGATVQALDPSDALLRLLDRDPAAAAIRVADVLRTLSRAGAPTDTAALVRRLLALGESAPAPALHGYADWVARHDTLSDGQLQRLQAAVATLPSRPMLSLLMPVSGLQPARLEACVDALIAQTYPDWELCLVAGECVPVEILAAIDRQLQRSTRVRVVRATADICPDGPTDEEPLLASALVDADGAFSAVIDDRLQLAPHALLMMVDAISRHPDADAFYADEDRLGVGGERFDPYFKPEFDSLLALSQGYLGPLLLCRTCRLRTACDAALAAGSASAHALALHATSGLTPADVIRVPHVLSHVAHDGGHAAVLDDGVLSRDIAGYLAVNAPDAQLTIDAGTPHIRHALPSISSKVSIVIPTRDRVDLLRRCVDSILGTSTYSDFEIVIVDNQSSDPDTLAYFEEVQSDARVRVLAYDQPFNYSAVNNFAVERVDGDVIALINNDVEVITADWIEEMLQYALRPDVGAVGAMLYYPDDSIQHAGVVLGLGGVAGHAYSHQPRGFAGQRGRARLVQRVGAVTAACLLVRREAYLQVGGLDESLAIAFNDVDFCLRLAEAGLSNVWTPFAELYHHESASRGTEDTPEKQARFGSEVHTMVHRWTPRLLADPAYHPNLSLTFDSAFVLAEPPRARLADWVDAVTDSVERARVGM